MFWWLDLWKEIEKADQFLFHWDLERRIQATIQSQNYESVSTQLSLVSPFVQDDVVRVVRWDLSKNHFKLR